MKKNNYNVNEISDMTGLSIDEINDIDLKWLLRWMTEKIRFHCSSHFA
jgi:hypothetical protein